MEGWMDGWIDRWKVSSKQASLHEVGQVGRLLNHDSGSRGCRGGCRERWLH